MIANVSIQQVDAGSVVRELEAHNVWTAVGREWLSRLISFSAIATNGTGTPEEDNRISGLALGIGGKLGDTPASNATLAAHYPAGYDIHGTAGNTYDQEHPYGPEIQSLERPIRISGGTNPYNTASPSDVWVASGISTRYPDARSVCFYWDITCDTSSILYSDMTTAPISEFGLCTSAYSPTALFTPVVAYLSTSPFRINRSTVLHVSWSIRFTNV
jgi:hypothetical protein